MDRKKAIKDLNNSVAILESNIRLYKRGCKPVYLVVANELRKLICDRPINRDNSKDNSLLPKLFDKRIDFFKVKTVQRNTNEKLIYQTYGAISMKNGITQITNLFDIKKELKDRIVLNEWLKQPIIFASEPITIQQFIKSVVDLEGVHSLNNYNKHLHAIKVLKIGDDDIIPALVVAIGEYVLAEIRYWGKKANFLSK